MILLFILVVIGAVVALVFAIATAGRLETQQGLTADASEQADRLRTELATATTSLEAMTRDKTAAEERALAAEEATTLSSEQAELAAQRAVAAEALVADAETRAVEAEERATAAEQRRSDVEAARGVEGDPGLDGAVLWALEQARSERLWRLSVAPDPDGESIFATTQEPLLEALRVELDAAREEVGAIVELETELAGELTPAAAVLTLRAAQELLAQVVRRSEETTLRVRSEGPDVVVTVEARDDHGTAVEADPLGLPTSLDAEATAGGVRVRNAHRGG